MLARPRAAWNTSLLTEGDKKRHRDYEKILLPWSNNAGVSSPD